MAQDLREPVALERLDVTTGEPAGVLARVPLASGLLTGKLSRASTFEETDHRSFNRNGEAFDKGETFSGVDFEQGLAAVEELRTLLPEAKVEGGNGGGHG